MHYPKETLGGVIQGNGGNLNVSHHLLVYYLSGEISFCYYILSDEKEILEK